MPLLLITGTTGHLGSRVLVKSLQAGYHVRAAVRSEAKAASIFARPEIQAVNSDNRLSFVIVPDITAPGAFEQAAQDVQKIIHIASPLANGCVVRPEDHEAHFVRPAVRGTLEMLEAANNSGTVRRVVITSSVVAIVPVDQLEGREPRTTPIDPNDRIPFTSGPYESEFAAYAASKVAALAHAEAWMAQERPPFDVVYLHPSFVLGRNDGATTVTEAMRGTNAVVLAMLLGKRFGPYVGATVHVDDVARAHLAALDPTVLGDQSYILSQPARWNDAQDIVAREFPTAMSSRLLVPGGNVDSVDLRFDVSLTELVFGFRHISFEDQVKDLVGQFLEIRIRMKLHQQQQQREARRHSEANGRASPQVRANA